MNATAARPVVVGVDGSTCSDAAVEVAAAEAAARGASLRIVHAYVWPLFYASLTAAPYPRSATEPDDDTRALVAAAAERAHAVRPNLVVSTEIVAGSAGPALVDASADASLVVVGLRGAGGFAGLLSGGVVSCLSTRARCPVVVVAKPAKDGKAPRVVAGFDGTDASLAALRFATAWAESRGWPVHAICAMPYINPEVISEEATAEQRRRAELYLWERMGGVVRDHPAVDITVFVAFGRTAAKVLLDASETASLLVVGSRGRGELASFVFGSLGSVLVHHAGCPVAVVPNTSAPSSATAGRFGAQAKGR